MYEILFFHHNQIYAETLISDFDKQFFSFILCSSVKESIHIVCTQSVKICVIEQRHPDSMSFLSALRLVDKSVLTLLICEGNSPDDKEDALKTDCDEYIFKPVIPKELKMRVNALSKKNKQYESDDADETTRLGQSVIDFKRRLFTTDNIPVSLTRKEAALLKLLLVNKNKLVTHEFILSEIWKTGSYYASKSMVVYVNKLRKKIKGDPSVILINLHGSGYILKEVVTETVAGN